MADPEPAAPSRVSLDKFYSMAYLPDHVELVDGRVVVRPRWSWEQGYLATDMFVAMDTHAVVCALGECFTGGCGYELPLADRPDTYRMPAASFVRAERIPRPRIRHRALAVAPDVAVEVLSPRDRYGAISAKVRDYLEAGTAAVWLVDPDARTVEVHARGGPERLLGENDTLEGGDAFPGFALPLAQLFAVLDD